MNQTIVLAEKAPEKGQCQRKPRADFLFSLKFVGFLQHAVITISREQKYGIINLCRGLEQANLALIPCATDVPYLNKFYKVLF